MIDVSIVINNLDFVVNIEYYVKYIDLVNRRKHPCKDSLILKVALKCTSQIQTRFFHMIICQSFSELF